MKDSGSRTPDQRTVTSSAQRLIKLRYSRERLLTFLFSNSEASDVFQDEPSHETDADLSSHNWRLYHSVVAQYLRYGKVQHAMSGSMGVLFTNDSAPRRQIPLRYSVLRAELGCGASFSPSPFLSPLQQINEQWSLARESLGHYRISSLES